jgi:hypothetical protein
MNEKQIADNLIDLLIVWAEKLEEEDQTRTQRTARSEALGIILAFRPKTLLAYFKATQEELKNEGIIEEVKPIEEMTDEEKLEIMVDMFNDEAIQA